MYSYSKLSCCCKKVYFSSTTFKDHIILHNSSTLPSSLPKSLKNGSAKQSQTHKKTTSKAQKKLKPTASPSLHISTFNPPLFAVSVFRAPPFVIVVANSVVVLIPPPEAAFVELGLCVSVAEATALNVVATEYDTGVITSPMLAQNPSSPITAEYTLGAAVWAYSTHVPTALSNAVGHQELVLI
jgi:hypothetical protein